MPELIINDSNYKDHIGDGQVVDFDGPRLLAAMPRRTDFGGCLVAEAFRPDLLIPRSEWPDRIRQKDLQQSWLYDLVADLPVKDQNGLGYCHAYAAVGAAECQRVLQGHGYVQLSAESIGGPITGWRNRGAHPEDDLEQLARFGACPQSMMDRENSISPSRWDSAWQTEREGYKCSEWWDLEIPGKAFDAAMTATLLGLPFFAGYQWWSHAVAGGFKARDLGRGKFAIMSRNSWGPNYGENGFFWLEEGKGTPNIGCFAVRQMIAKD